MRFTIDSNLLIYSVDTENVEKQRIASNLVVSATLADCVLTTQVLGEFLRIVRKRNPAYLPDAIAQAERWAAIFPVIDTSPSHVVAAALFAERYRLQYWDSVIWQAASSAGARVFLSEDMQDGFTAEGVKIVNPLLTANAEAVGILLTPAP